jgi:hypothetical protein
MMMVFIEILPHKETGYYIDQYNRLYTTKKGDILKCKVCNHVLSYSSNYGIYCTDNILHNVT